MSGIEWLETVAGNLLVRWLRLVAGTSQGGFDFDGEKSVFGLFIVHETSCCDEHDAHQNASTEDRLGWTVCLKLQCRAAPDFFYGSHFVMVTLIELDKKHRDRAQ